MAAGDYLNKITPEDEAELQAAFAQLTAQYADDSDGSPSTPPEDPSDDEDETGDDGAGGESEEDDESGDDDSESGDESVDLGNGTKLSPDELKSLAEFKRFLDNDPATRANLDAARSIPPPPPPAQPVAALPSQPLEAPPGLDLDDPSIKTLWEAYTNLATTQQRINQEAAARVQQESVRDVERAVSDWSSKYKVSDTVLAGIRIRAAQSNVVPALTSTGKTTYEAVVAALDQAFWSDDDLRTQYLNAASSDAKAAEKAQRSKTRKLGAISGRGTTTGGTKPVRDMTPEERRAAMSAEIAEHMARS